MFQKRYKLELSIISKDFSGLIQAFNKNKKLASNIVESDHTLTLFTSHPKKALDLVLVNIKPKDIVGINITRPTVRAYFEEIIKEK